MSANCTDCNKRLKRVDYVRALRLGQSLETVERRDPLCKPCWKEDYGRARGESAKANLGGSP